MDKSSPPPHHVNRAVKEHDDKADTSSPDLPMPSSEGDAAYAISQLPKGRGPVASKQVINMPNGPKNKI
ncbi:hypothetical protein FoTM2_016755 [Fusarium oxysporum f. sp. vasinfectum]|nr:hypothetical protein FoTM2_016755 [Fusarium oxysporum f. sp. vasinfectum]